MEELLTVREVAKRLKVSVPLVYKLCGEGKLPCLRFGTGRGTLRVSEIDLTAFVEGCKATQPSTNAGLKHIKLPGSPRP